MARERLCRAAKERIKEGQPERKTERRREKIYKATRATMIQREKYSGTE